MTTEPVPESASPALAEGLASQITVIYAAAETEIITVIATRVRHAVSAGNATTSLLNDTHHVQAETARTLARVERDSGTAVRRALASAYGRGRGGTGTAAGGTIRNVLERLAALRTGVTRWVTGLWQRLIGLSATPDPDRRRALIARTLARAATRGVTAYTPTGQRTAVSLATEVVQHAAGGAVIDGFGARLTEAGRDLVIVTLSPHPCPVCLPYEHRVLSVSGDSDRYLSLREARAGGLFHPRC